MMKKLTAISLCIFVIIAVIATLFISGCAAKMVKMYKGSEKPIGEVAVVKTTSGLMIGQVDGKRANAKSIIVNPGPHILSIDFHHAHYTSDKPIVRGVNLLVGRTYIVKIGEITDGLIKGSYFAPVYVEDSTTGIDVSFRSKEIHEAAEVGDIAAVKLNLEVNPNQVNIKKYQNWASLHYAARYGHSKVAELLIAKGAEIDIKNKYRWTPLHLAARYGLDETVELLIMKGANVNAMQKGGWTPLHFAARYGYDCVAELLIANGAEVNAMQKGGWTPLHFAARYGYDETVELLIMKGAEVNEMDNRAHTPLYWAVKHGHMDVAESLRKHGGMGDK